MENTVRLNDDLVVARFEPAREDFRRIAAEGFRSVVSLQTRDEDQKVAIAEERKAAEDAGLAFHHQPVGKENLDDGMVDEFREALSRLPHPVLLHCASGKRSGAFAMMHLAAEEGMSGDETLEKAEAMGFECDTPELEDFVRGYVDRHRGA